MKAVIQSDFYCSKASTVFYMIFMLTFAVLVCVGMPPLLTLFPFALFNFSIFQRTQISENCGWEKYLTASGMSRKAQVSARFSESAAVNLGTAAVFTVAMAINTLFVKKDNILSPAQIFMFVALDIFVGAVYSLLVAVYYIISDPKTRGAAYIIALLAIMFLPQLALHSKSDEAAQLPLMDLSAKSAVLCGAALLAAAAAVYAGLYAAAAARFERKEM